MTDQLRDYRRAAKTIGPGFKPGFLSQPFWEDDNFDVLSITVPGNNNAPTAYTIPTKNLILPNFPNGADITEVGGSREIPHAWEVGTSIYPHGHVRKLSTGNGSILLGFEYEILLGSTLVEGSDTITVELDNVTQLNELVFAGFDAIDLSTITEVGAQLTFRFYRDPTDAADDFAGDIAVPTIGFHYQRNTSGSRQITTK